MRAAVVLDLGASVLTMGVSVWMNGRVSCWRVKSKKKKKEDYIYTCTWCTRAANSWKVFPLDIVKPNPLTLSILAIGL